MQNALPLELFIGNAPNTTTKTNKLLSYSDDDNDSVYPSKQTKVFVNFVYCRFNPSRQPTQVTESVAYLSHVLLF